MWIDSLILRVVNCGFGLCKLRHTSSFIGKDSMVRNEKIAQYQRRLDRTLASQNLTDEKKLKALVKDQMLRSPQHQNEENVDNLVKMRTAEASKLLDMFRSTPKNDVALPHKPYAGWKLKQDNEDYCVMYREGLLGSPFHALLVDGYVDAPLDTCLFVAWEASFFPTLFPETKIPSFKVTAKCLQKVRIGEQFILVRTKLSWPLTDRYVVLHYFELEYLEGDLVIIVMNSMSDVEILQRETHGFSIDEIPEAGHAVNVDLVGGFAFQKVSKNRSFMRLIQTFDLKLEFVPPTLINFISRQVVSNTFRLYKKSVTSTTKAEKNFGKAMDDPLFKRVHEAFYSNGKSNQCNILGTGVGTQHHDVISTVAFKSRDDDNESLSDYQTVKEDWEDSMEFEDDGDEGSRDFDEDSKWRTRKSTEANEESSPEWPSSVRESCHFHKEKVQLNPLVSRALGTLQRAISTIREVREGSPGVERGEPKWFAREGQAIRPNKEVLLQSTEEKIIERTSQQYRDCFDLHNLRPTGTNSLSEEMTPCKIATAAAEQNFPRALSASYVNRNGSIEAPLSGKSMHEGCPRISVDDNYIDRIKLIGQKKSGQLKKWVCCLYPTAGGFV
ncbi:hypothetical protein Nepgr_030934 [Nepenthes gracilis]|uniref:START domain-containing protein n=1 Tax=Nepenthes gracilis TaxID=150966 RepID=A0AAD3THI5_NEPGR|nr:hypothetical protein Nepgr_030934 [Nepenthes gracilis]